MNIKKNYKLPLIVLGMLYFNACKKQLDLSPVNSVTSAQQYSTAAGYKAALAKVYGCYSLISSNGTGSSDINVAGISDVGETDFLRTYWNAQELSTDEDVCAWNDGDLQAFHNGNWTSSNLYLTALYDRSLFQITVCNEFIRQSSDALIASHGFTGEDAQNIRYYRSEARFLRAFQYWVLMDLYGNPPFVTENDPIAAFIPPRIKRADLFNYIESELKSVDSSMVAPHQNEYARADQAAAEALLARMYLNAQIYTGTARYNDAITYASKVINEGYVLMPDYSSLFRADNNVNNTEIILPIAYDGNNSQNYGGTTFLINAAHNNNDSTELALAGIPHGGWLGNRSTQNLPLAFTDYSGNTDKRAKFGSGTLNVADELNFSDGLEVTKFNNVDAHGVTAPSPNGQISSVDFPLFRLAEMYLIYIEATTRGGNGNGMLGLQYFNALRERAYGNTNGNVSSYTLDDILNERQRELYWECFRRTDLIRYGYFTSGTYIWPWKGGVLAGTALNSNYDLFPIPSTDILTNTNLKQNTGY